MYNIGRTVFLTQAVDFNIFEGMVVHGVPVVVISQGRVCVQNGKVSQVDYFSCDAITLCVPCGGRLLCKSFFFCGGSMGARSCDWVLTKEVNGILSVVRQSSHRLGNFGVFNCLLSVNI